MIVNAEYFDHIYLAVGYTDLRRGIDGLVGIIREKYQLDPYEKALFLFCGRRNDRIKAITWDGDGFLLCYKRLETGSFQWPRNGDEAKSLTAQQYRWLTEGLSINQKKRIPKVYPGAFSTQKRQSADLLKSQ